MHEELKRMVLKAAQSAEKERLCRRRSGNFSQLSASRDMVAITPSGLDRQEMEMADIIIIDRKGNIIENAKNNKPSSEVPMHLAAYEARPDVMAVAHTHSPYALAFAIAEKPVPPILAECAHLNCQYGHIPVAIYGKVGSKMLADSVRGPLNKGDAILLAHHGVLTVSESDVDDALLKAGYVEDICAAYYRSLVLTQWHEPCLIPLADLKL